MKAVLALVLVALLVVCAQSRRAFPGKNYGGLIKPRWVFNKKAVVAAAEDEDDEESDFWMALAPLAINLIKNKLSKKRDAVDEDDEEADFLGKINWRKVGDFAKNVGKQYLNNKYGLNLDEEEEESDFINWKKIGSIAKDIGKTYLSSKYGINLDEEVDAEEESDAEFLGKLKAWWSSKGENLFQKGLQIYSAIKSAKKAAPAPAPAVEAPVEAEVPVSEAPAEEQQVESDSEATDCGESYTAGRPTGRKQCVTIDGSAVVTSTAEVFNRMKAAASAAGVTLKLNSGFRTQAEQTRLYNCYIHKNCNNGNLAAKPGFSNHQNGIALDINVSTGGAYNWLVANASKYGFVRTVASEKWHWELRNSKCNAFVSYACK